jgi:NO-binding membrane sensor protein with MHYT domain
MLPQASLFASVVFVFAAFYLVLVRIPERHVRNFLKLQTPKLVQSISAADLKTWATQPFILQGGLLAGAGVTSMHYLGMISAVGVKVTFKPALVVLSFLLAVFAATAALLMLMFIFEGKLARTLSALVMGIAVCGMHYTGMAATEFRYSGETLHSYDTFNVGVVVAMIAAFICLGMHSIQPNAEQNQGLRQTQT